MNNRETLERARELIVQVLGSQPTADDLDRCMDAVEEWLRDVPSKFEPRERHELLPGMFFSVESGCPRPPSMYTERCYWVHPESRIPGPQVAMVICRFRRSNPSVEQVRAFLREVAEHITHWLR